MIEKQRKIFIFAPCQSYMTVSICHTLLCESDRGLDEFRDGIYWSKLWGSYGME